jgi:hypothetical protein
MDFFTRSQYSRWLRFPSLILVFFYGSAVWGAGLTNSGFENGETGWQRAASANSIEVVGVEGSEFDIYGSRGITVAPHRGSAMLRLGLPEEPGDQNNNQNDGDTEVTQTFTAASSGMSLAIRIFSTEFRRNRDSVTVAISDGATISGISGCSSGPSCVVRLDAGLNGDVLAPASWDEFTVSGMIKGNMYQISYRLTTGGGDSHPSWVYFDDVNAPPVADAGDDAQGFVGDPVTLDGSGSDDPEGDPLTFAWALINKPAGSGATLDDATFEMPGFTPDLLGDYTAQLIVNDGELDSEPDTVTITVVNQPPVAEFSCNPGGLAGTEVVEGDVIACDASASSDPDGQSIVTYDWEVSGPGIVGTTQLSGPIVGFVAEDDGFYTITLHISDGIDESCASNNDGGCSGLSTAPSLVGNVAPIAGGIDVEVLQGGVATLRCRGVDPGADDLLSAVFMGLPSAGNEGPVVQITENDPAYATLAASVEFDTAPEGGAGVAPTTYTAPYCEVMDDSGESGTGGFSITVLDPSELYPICPPTGPCGRFEPNDSSEGVVPVLNPGTTTLARLESATDVDFFEIRLDDNSVPPNGAELLIRLKMPADYDAVLLSRPVGDTSTVFESAPFVSFPFVSFPFVSFEQRTTPFVSFPFVSFPQQTAPFVSFPFVSFPFVSFPFETSPFVSFAENPAGGWSVEDFPLSQMADAPSGVGSSGDFVGLSEIGSLNLEAFEDENLRVKDLSANVNTPEAPFETLFGVKTADEETIYVAVLSFDGNLSTAPYEITVETSQPLDTEVYLDSACDGATPCNCTGTPLIGATTPTIIGEGSSTLIVTQRERLQALEDLHGQQWTDFVAEIEPLLEAADAKLVSVDSADAIAAFAEWDSHPCDVEKLGPLTDALKAFVQAQLAANPLVNSVIILGDFDVWPSASELDFTHIGNEGLFLRDLPVRSDTQIAAVFRAGHFLSDACLTDSDPFQFNGGLFCVEDLPTGRLLSTERALEQLHSYGITGGLTPYDSGLVSGYEFFSDVAGSMANSLTNLGGSLHLLNNETWRSNDPANPANSLEPQWCEVVRDVAGVQAHASFNALLAAGGFNDVPQDFTVDECPGDPGSLTASIGCHTLTFVPESATLPKEFFPVDPSLNWADRGGTWVGTYGFGLGHTDTDELGTEGILKRFFACIGSNGSPETALSVGECLLTAKLEYLQSRTSIDAYDVKSVMTLAISGIPDVTVVPTAVESSALFGPQALAADPCTDGVFLDLTVQDGGTTNVTQHCLKDVSVPGKGTYVTADGQAQAGSGRPLLATLQVFDQEVPAGSAAARSMSLEGGTFDLQIGVDPVMGNLETEWDQIQESKACGSWAPTEIGVFNVLPIGGVVEEAFNLTTAQFECTLTEADKGVLDTVGNQRKYTALDVEVMRPPLALVGDVNPPDVLQRDIVANATSGDALAILNARDENGMARMQVNVYTEDREFGGVGTVESFACPGPNCVVDSLSTCTAADCSDPQPSEIFLPGAAGKLVAIEYFDEAYNKVQKSGKGVLVETVEVVFLNTNLNLGSLSTIRVEIERLQKFLNDGLTLMIDYGDGTSAVFPIDATTPECSATVTENCITFIPDGSCELDDPPSCSGVFQTTHEFKVEDPNNPPQSITVTATLRGAASGYDEAVLTRCVDDIGETDPDGDIASCAFSASGTNVDIDLFVDGMIDDQTFKYRLNVFGEQFQYAKGKLSRPAGVQGTVTLLGDNGLRFSFDAADLGWDGETAFLVEQSTQDGVKGSPSQGRTDNNVFEASVGAPGI